MINRCTYAYNTWSKRAKIPSSWLAPLAARRNQPRHWRH